MSTGAPWNLPFPVLNDIPNVPSDIQALAEATDTALDTLSGRQAANYASTLRGTQDSFTNGSMVSLGLSASIGSAQPGIYLVTYSIALYADATRSANLRITADGNIINGDVPIGLGTDSRLFAGAVPYSHGSTGTLTVASFCQVVGGTGTVRQGSHIAVTRIGQQP